MSGTVPAPPPGALFMDTERGRVGAFHREADDRWELRAVAGRDTWTVAPSDARPATATERLQAANARLNARSRGELL